MPAVCEKAECSVFKSSIDAVWKLRKRASIVEFFEDIEYFNMSFAARSLVLKKLFLYFIIITTHGDSCKTVKMASNLTDLI